MSVLDILKSYLERPTDTNQDFDEVASQVPADALGSGIADAFRSDRTADFGQMAASLFGRSNAQQQAGLLGQLNADADHTNVGCLFRLLSGSAITMDSALSQRLRTPPLVPTTSIYSRSDGVAAWETCVHDKTSTRVQDIEVDGSHIGMGWNRDVLDTVTDGLRKGPGSFGVNISRIETAGSRLTQAPLPWPERLPPLPPDGPPPLPPEGPPPLELPPQSPPEIHEPDLPGEHMPIGDGPRRAAVAPPGDVHVARLGTAC